MSAPKIPQTPLIDKDGSPFYPITQHNQVITPDGGRWNGLQIPDNGTTGQVLKKTGDNDRDISWSNISNSWDQLEDKPEVLNKANIEEWTFTLDDGSVITRKVLIND